MSKASREQRIKEIKDNAVATGLELMNAQDMTPAERLEWAEVTLIAAASHVELLEGSKA